MSLPQLPRRGAGRWVASQGLDRPQLPRRGAGRWVVQRLIQLLRGLLALAAMLGRRTLIFLFALRRRHTIHRGKDRQGETHRSMPGLRHSPPAKGQEELSRCPPVYLQAFPKVPALRGPQVHGTSPAQQLLQPYVLLLVFPYGWGR